MYIPYVTSEEELVELVNAVGFLPFFRNPLPGFSLEEHIDPYYWFNDEADGAWEWKGPVILDAQCAYGKFFRNKAGFISKEWYPDFANWRRDGYDFDALFADHLARYDDQYMYQIFEKHPSLLTRDLKRIGDFGKDRMKGFDTIITRLQMMGYVVIGNFEYQISKSGELYGWGMARYETPEHFFGEAFTQHVYDRAPEESKERIFRHIQNIWGPFDEKDLEKFLRRQSV